MENTRRPADEGLHLAVLPPAYFSPSTTKEGRQVSVPLSGGTPL